MGSEDDLLWELLASNDDVYQTDEVHAITYVNTWLC